MPGKAIWEGLLPANRGRGDAGMLVQGSGTTGHSCRAQSREHTFPPSMVAHCLLSKSAVFLGVLFPNGLIFASLLPYGTQNQSYAGAREDPEGESPRVWVSRAESIASLGWKKIGFHKKLRNSTNLEQVKVRQSYSSPAPKLASPWPDSPSFKPGFEKLLSP